MDVHASNDDVHARLVSYVCSDVKKVMYTLAAMYTLEMYTVEMYTLALGWEMCTLGFPYR